jgi:hypothetical protein
MSSLLTASIAVAWMNWRSRSRDVFLGVDGHSLILPYLRNSGNFRLSGTRLIRLILLGRLAPVRSE